MILITNLFCCPVCSQPLFISSGSYRCANRHTFDIASDGHVSLLPSGKGGGKTTGDSREMIAARSRFLGKDFYSPLRDELASYALRLSAEQGNPVRMLDAGSGEGYYTLGVCEKLSKEGLCCTAVGVDLSKSAVQIASKAARRQGLAASFAVASIFDLPLGDLSVDLIISIFAPVCEGEFARVLRHGGLLLIAAPGSRHLYGLKEVLYDQPYLNEENPHTRQGFDYVGSSIVDYKIHLDESQQIADLFLMTPYYWHTPRQAAERLNGLTALETEISFEVCVFRKPEI